MNVLVDSSAWIAYFRGVEGSSTMDRLIAEGLLATNGLILAEILPALLLRREDDLVFLLREMECLPLRTDWEGIVQMQVTCLRNGVNKMGIPDLMIVQNAIQNHAAILTLDKHFTLMARLFPCDVLT